MNVLSFFKILKARNELLFWLGLACAGASGLSVLLIMTTHTSVLGTNAWYKPLKFFLSTTIFVWSMGWYTGYLTNPSAVIAYSWGMIALFIFEDGYIALQAARGQLSHFNVSASFYVIMYGLMALGAVTISVWTAYIGFSFFRYDFPQLSPAYLWGIRLGLIIFVLFSMQGLVMGGLLRHTIGAPDGGPGLPVLNWSRTHGDLRIAHFLGMHALQILPILAYYLVQNVKGVLLLGMVYGLLTTAIFVEALQGKPLISYSFTSRHRTR